MGKFMNKLFIKNDNGIKKIVPKPYDPAINKDYYSYVKRYCDKGFNQFIITSEYMMELLEYYFLERKFSITEIIFLEDDLELEENISWHLERLTEDRAYYNKLIDRLKFLFDDSSIDIKRIVLQGKLLDQKKGYMSIMAQVNGIYSIDLKQEEHFNEENKKIISIIEGR